MVVIVGSTRWLHPIEYIFYYIPCSKITTKESTSSESGCLWNKVDSFYIVKGKVYVFRT